MKRIAQSLHATTWWGFAIAAVVLSTISTSALFLAIIIFLSLLSMLVFRDETLRSKSFIFYVVIAFSVVVIRFGFRIVFNQPDAFQAVALNLPVIRVGEWISLFGPVSLISLQSALVDGLRLAAIIVAIGMANTVANPRRLLRSTPGALYEFATAAAVAINLAPQLIESLHRVRRARSLRSKTKGFRALRTIIIPVLEDAIDRSLSLAASMDSRGFGRQESAGTGKSWNVRLLSIGALLLLAIGTFTLLTSDLFVLAVGSISIGLVLLALTFRAQSAKQLRTYYRPEKPSAKDLIALTAVTLALFGVSLI